MRASDRTDEATNRILGVTFTFMLLLIGFGAFVTHQTVAAEKALGSKSLDDSVHRVYDAETGVACYWVTTNVTGMRMGASSVGISCVKVKP